MKKLVGILTVILSAQTGFAGQFAPGTKIQCGGQPGTGFVLEVHEFDVPRVAPYDDAIITFEKGQHNWKWLQLAAYNQGALTSQHVYNILGGGQLLISESVRMGRGGCGRGSCDFLGNSKAINAKLTTSYGQQHGYACKKIQ
jgi:hypothetical protein